MTDKPTVGKQGTRYSPEQKAEIFNFIEAYNTEHKRGGMKAASDKFGVSVVTLSNWGKPARVAKKKKARAKAKKAPAKKVVKAVAKPKAAPQDPNQILDRMKVILAEIGKLEKEYAGLKAKL